MNSAHPGWVQTAIGGPAASHMRVKAAKRLCNWHCCRTMVQLVDTSIWRSAFLGDATLTPDRTGERSLEKRGDVAFRRIYIDNRRMS